MKLQVFALFLTFAVYAQAATEEEEIKNLGEYLKRFSSIDVDSVLQNDRLFNAYFNCFMEKGPCIAEAKALRKVLPITVNTACGSCTLDQKQNAKKALLYIKEKRAKQWDELVEKYDPNGTQLEIFLKSVPS